MLGMQEMIVIMVVALIIFGPRKLPELGKSIGQAMAQFRRASEDFKRTWEQEVEVEKVKLDDNSSATKSESSGDYSYGYDSSTDTASNAAGSEYQAESAASEPTSTTSATPVAEPAATAKSAEPHWI